VITVALVVFVVFVVVIVSARAQAIGGCEHSSNFRAPPGCPDDGSGRPNPPTDPASPDAPPSAPRGVSGDAGFAG
jgi:hypothetical protein